MHCCVFNTAVLRYRYIDCLVRTASVRWTAARLKCRATPDGVRFGRGLNLRGASWRDSSEHIMRLINLLV
jgi:hypothetical protein